MRMKEHTGAGIVDEEACGAADDGDAVRPGDRVVVQPTMYCRACRSCLGGFTNCCPRLGFLGISGRGGGLSDYVCADSDAVFKLPDSVPLRVGG